VAQAGRGEEKRLACVFACPVRGTGMHPSSNSARPTVMATPTNDLVHLLDM
jgi:hypothetical protein